MAITKTVEDIITAQGPVRFERPKTPRETYSLAGDG
jgi:hypothetical protein